ncbi:MAG: STAS domain-containing protein [Dehalococcoidia bacterium]
MSLRTRSVEDVQIVQMDGDFTVGPVPMARPLDLQGRRLEDLGTYLVEILDRGHRKIILDMSRVGFMDSAGLGELVACKKRTVERGGDIKLLRPVGQVHKLLVMTLLTRLFEVYQDEETAVNSF